MTKKLTVYRDGLPIHKSDGGIPPHLLKPGDTVHLSAGIWECKDLEWMPLKINGVEVTGTEPGTTSTEDLINRAILHLRRTNSFYEVEPCTKT